MSKKKNFILLFLLSLISLAMITTSSYAAYNFVYNGTEFHRDCYDYAPSIMVDGTVTKMWWGGQNTDGFDGVFYSYKPDGGAWSTPQLILAKQGTGWESGHVNDPTVIKGSFTCDGSNYTYAMYYGACPDDINDCQIGAAFSNDGINWHRYSQNPIIINRLGLKDDYGAGLPIAYSTGGSNVTLFYFDSGINNAVIKLSSTDGINFSSPYRLPFQVSMLGDITYNTSESKWYVAVKAGDDKELYIYRSNTDSLVNDDWDLVGTVTQSLTGNWLNHNPGWYRLPNGDMYVSSGNKYIDFGSQTSSWGITDPNYWDIGKVTLSGSADSISSPGSFGLISPANNANVMSVNPLNPSFSWQPSSNARNYILTVSESSSLDPNDSGQTTPIRASIHKTSTNDTDTFASSGILLPNKLYYWNVKAVNSNGTISSSTFQFKTMDHYSWDFDDNSSPYNGWRSSNDDGANASKEVPDAPTGLLISQNAGIATEKINSATNVIHLGDVDNYGSSPSKVDISSMNKFVIKMKNRSSATTVRISYLLTSQRPLNATYYYKDFQVVANDTVFREYVFDMTGMPGWNTGNNRLAEVKINFNTSSGYVDYDYIKIAGSSYSKDVKNEYMPVVAVTASSEDNTWNKNMVIDYSDSTSWKSTTYTDENHTEWIQMDLGLVDKIAKIRISPPESKYCLPKKFDIETSSDGVTWNIINTYLYANLSEPVTINVQDSYQSARYVKLKATRLRNDDASFFAKIGEITLIRDISNLVNISNQDFENGDTSGWTLWSPDGNTNHIYVETGGAAQEFKTSQYHATICNSTGKSGALVRTVYGLTAGATYTVRVWTTTSGRQAWFKVQNYGGINLETYTTNTSWTPLTFNVTLGQNNTSMDIHLYAEAGAGGSYVYFDNFEIIKN